MDKVLWSSSRKDVIAQITSRQKKKLEFKINESMRTNEAGNWAKRETEKSCLYGKRENHYVRLKLLRGGKRSTALADFMANLIKQEIAKDPITDPKTQPTRE